MKVSIIMTHEVKDFAAWKKGFDAGKNVRTSAGVTIEDVYQSVKNPNLVTVIGEAPSAKVAKGFLESDVLKSAMEKAGVLSSPEVKILKKHEI